MNFGGIVAVGAWGLFVGLVFYGFGCSVARWWDEARWARDEERLWEQLRMSEEMCSVIVTDEDAELAEAEARMWSEVAELLR